MSTKTAHATYMKEWKKRTGYVEKPRDRSAICRAKCGHETHCVRRGMCPACYMAWWKEQSGILPRDSFDEPSPEERAAIEARLEEMRAAKEKEALRVPPVEIRVCRLRVVRAVRAVLWRESEGGRY